jgi:hypothetical protein
MNRDKNRRLLMAAADVDSEVAGSLVFSHSRHSARPVHSPASSSVGHGKQKETKSNKTKLIIFDRQANFA